MPRKKVIASNGYVLVYVGKTHHLADVRGYAYEHRIAAESMLGRRLRRGEVVHHADGRKTNNAEANLIVCPTLAHHALAHRSPSSTRRIPGSRNSTRACKCGCGALFAKYDSAGRQREYVSGHNPTASPTQNAVVKAFEEGRKTLHAVAFQLGTSLGAVRLAASKLRRAGKLPRWAFLRTRPIVKRIRCACGCRSTLTNLDKSGRVRRYISGHNRRKNQPMGST